METDKLSQIASTVYYPAQQQTAGQPIANPNAQSPAAGSDTQGVYPAASDQVSLTTSSATLKSLDTAKTIEQIKANAVAGEANNKLNNMTGWLNQMQANLTEIVKNYPPFPPDSVKRKDLLMSYASIRQEIIKMTVPAPSAPAYEKVKGMWSSLFGQNGRIVQNAIPELHAASSDSEVGTAAATLGNTGDILANIRAGVGQTSSQS